MAVIQNARAILVSCADKLKRYVGGAHEVKNQLDSVTGQLQALNSKMQGAQVKGRIGEMDKTIRTIVSPSIHQILANANVGAASDCGPKTELAQRTANGLVSELSGIEADFNKLIARVALAASHADTLKNQIAGAESAVRRTASVL